MPFFDVETPEQKQPNKKVGGQFFDTADNTIQPISAHTPGEVVKAPPSKLEGVKKVGKKVVDELAGVGEAVRHTVNSIGMFPADVGNFAGAVVDSIVQEDLSRENFDRNMARREETVTPIRNILNPRPTYETGKRMVEGLEEGMAAPGKIIHEAVQGGLTEQGYYPDGTPMPRQLSVRPEVAAQIAGPASIAADAAPFVAVERGLRAALPSTYAPKPGTPRGIGTNTTPSNFQIAGEGPLVTPNKLNRPGKVAPPVEPARLALPEPERIARRRADVEAAVKADDEALANEIANAREERAVSLRNEDYVKQDELNFNHDNLPESAVTPRDSMEAVGPAKPVVKGTVGQIVDMARSGEINAKDHYTIYPEGVRNPDSPAYVINKNAAGKNLAQIKKDLQKGKDSEWLGYPDREGVPTADLVTKAVTKDNRILSNPAEIKAEAEAGNVKWSAEGREADVQAKAEEIVTQNPDSLVGNKSNVGDSIPQEVKTSPTSNLDVSDTILEPKREATDTIPKQDGTVDLHAGIHPKEIVRGIDEGIKYAKNLVGKAFPQSVKDIARSALGFPEFVAENIPSFKPIYEAALARVGKRESIAHKVYGEELGYEGMGPLHKLEKKASRQERADFNTILETQDIERRTFTSDELRSGQNPLGRAVSETVVQMHAMTERIMQRFAEVLIDGTRELVFKSFEKEAWFNELKDMVEQGVTAEQYKQSPYHNRDLARALGQVQKDLAKHAELVDLIQKNPGYMFRERPGGERHVRIYKIDEFGDRQEVYMRPTKNQLGAERMERAINSALNEDGTVKNPERLQKFLKKNYDEAGTYEVETKYNQQVSEDIIAFSGTPTAKSSLVKKVIDDVIAKKDVDPADAKRIGSAVLDELTDVYRSRGFGRRMMRRKDHLIEGYDNTNYVDTITGQVSAMAGWLSKAEYAIQAMQHLKDVAPEYQAYANKYIRNTLKNSDPTLAKLGATARTALALKTLAFKPATILINGTQNLTIGIGEYNLRMRKLGLKQDGTAQIVTAMGDMVRHSAAELRGKSFLKPYEKKAIDEFSRIGGDKAQGVREIAGLTEPGASRVLTKVTQVGMTPFSKVETVLNREAAFLAMFRKLSKEGMPYETAFKEAADFTNTVHFDMSQHNLPVYFQNEVGRTTMSLQRYSGMYLNYIFNRAIMQQEYRPVVRSLVTLAAMGGLSALGLGQLDSLMARKLGTSPRTLLRKYVIGKGKGAGLDPELAEKLSVFVDKGLPAALGADISRNIEVQAPFISTLISGDAETAGEALSGAWASAGNNLMTGAKALKTGQYMRAAEALSPVDAFANVLKAHRMYSKGATSVSGNPILDREGEKLKLTESEAVLRALGIQPTRLSSRYDIQSVAKKLNTYYTNKKADINTAIRTAETPEEKERAREEKRKLNEDLKKYNGLIPSMGRTRNNRKAQRRIRRFEDSILNGGDDARDN